MFCCDFSLIKSRSLTDSSDDKHVLFSSNSNIETFINENFGLFKNNYYVLCNGKRVNISEKELNPNGGILRIVPRIYGGKGGFGSMLRAIGAQIEKTTNREACRDLSGRRLRDINEEQRLKNWISQQADREREAEERKQKKLERLCQEPKHEFKDEKYDESRSALPEKMSTSIDQGFKACSSGTSSSNLKRKNNSSDKNKSKYCKKKKKLWIDAEDSDVSSSENDSDNEEIVSKQIQPL